ncbi:MAG: hypothetical protein L0Z50_26775 [Verrucomicrobiales bacterium]|nr:hypothetical protein [Verrucomicrobiales bacterium]
MARRAPVDEKPFRPLDVSVLNAVVHHRSETTGENVQLSDSAKVVELTEMVMRPSLKTDAAAGLARVMQRLDHEKRVLFTREETQALDRLVNQLAARLRTQVKASHVLRAVTSLLLNAEARIDHRAGERGALTRPPNGDFGALQRFERDIAQILAHALRDAGPPR